MTGTLRLHDTMTRESREIVAADGRELRFYACGPTVYGPAHIGNFRTFLVQDLFRRVVELTGLPVRHVRNLTDVDDKTIRESRAEGVSLEEFTGRWTARFRADCAALGMLTPTVEASAVAHIPQQVALIERLVDRGLAYVAPDGSVYYRIAAFPAYGRLSRVAEREMAPGAGAAAIRDDEYEKDDVADFALWKARRPEDGDNAWESPWGPGRPGWHIECSAMAIELLGETFDIHSGGVDLIFPHHENEIAQSEGATGVEFVRHWFHVEHLMVDGGKMSRSVGTIFTLEEIEDLGHGVAELRYALMAGHYRQRLNFGFDSLAAARLNLERIAALVDGLARAAGAEGLPGHEELTAAAARGDAAPSPFDEAFAALLDDLNAPKALGRLFSAAKPLETALEAGELDADRAAAALHGLAILVAAFGWALPERRTSAEVPEAVRALADRRWTARLARDWAAADAMRDELAAAGWRVEDGPDAYTLTPV